LYAIPSILTINVDYEHRRMNSNSSCLLCIVDTITALLTVDPMRGKTGDM